MSNEESFVKYSADKLEQHMGRIETCVAKLTPDQICARHSTSENAIGNLLLHLTGNVRQWILTGIAGQQDVRQRDAEFAAQGAEFPLRPVGDRAALAVR